jgi:glycosyltransferase involved in cell wall biosynthesis
LPGDSTALASAIAEIMGTPESDRRAMGQRGRNLVDTQYSIKAITDRYEALFETVTARRGR